MAGVVHGATASNWRPHPDALSLALSRGIARSCHRPQTAPDPVDCRGVIRPVLGASRGRPSCSLPPIVPPTPLFAPRKMPICRDKGSIATGIRTRASAVRGRFSVPDRSPKSRLSGGFAAKLADRRRTDNPKRKIPLETMVKRLGLSQEFELFVVTAVFGDAGIRPPPAPRQSSGRAAHKCRLSIAPRGRSRCQTQPKTPQISRNRRPVIQRHYRSICRYFRP